VLAGARTAAREARAVAIPPALARPRFDVVRALGHVETKKLLQHPAFLAGLGLSAFFLLQAMLGAYANSEYLGAIIVGMIGVGLFVATPLGANACALRADRSGLRELFGSLPSVPETRTAGLLLGVVRGPVLLTVAVAIVAYPVLRAVPEFTQNIDLVLLAQAPLTTLALGAMGVGVARWLRHPIGGPLIIVAHVFTGLMWVAPWVAEASGPDGVQMGWHYGYLVAHIVLWTSIAFAGDRRRTRALIVPALAFVAVMVCAAQQFPEGGLA
jgi:hypothetical protein